MNANFVEHAILKCEIAKKVWENWIDCPISLLEGRRDFSDIALDMLRQGTKRDPKGPRKIFWGGLDDLV